MMHLDSKINVELATIALCFLSHTFLRRVKFSIDWTPTSGLKETIPFCRVSGNPFQCIVRH